MKRKRRLGAPVVVISTVGKADNRDSLCLKAQKQHMYRQVPCNYAGATFSLTQ